MKKTRRNNNLEHFHVSIKHENALVHSKRLSEQMEPAKADVTAPVSLRTQTAVYGIGVFNTSVFQIGAVIIPLHVYTMNPSPFMFGLVFAAAHFLPLLFSIHAGGLMDRLGARRVMLVCTLGTALLPLLYPAATWIWALIFLQLFLGFSETLGWLGAQTMIGQYMHGKTVYAGRLSFSIRISQFIAPPMAGVTWDYLGPWAAFILMGIWAAGGFFCALLVPKLPAGMGGEITSTGRGAFGRLMPRASDYITAFGLLASPAIVQVGDHWMQRRPVDAPDRIIADDFNLMWCILDLWR